MPDDRRVVRLLALLALVAAADAALVGWWGLTESWLSSSSFRPPLFALFGLAVGRRPPPQLLAAGLALLGLGALARLLIGQAAIAIVYGVGIGSIALVLGFATARIDRPIWRQSAALVLIVAALLLPFGRWEAAATRGVGPSVAVLSSLPLGVTGSREGQRLMRALKQHGPVTLLDSVPAGGPTEQRLLLIQPRALLGEEMVAIDDWVRRGGQAVVLDDPQLDWRGDRPLGAPGAPLTASLLDPLMARWGVRLELPAVQELGPRTIPLEGGALTLPSSGFFTRLSPDCTLLFDARVARCQVGAGDALMIADADWIDPRRWSAQRGASGLLEKAIATGELRPPSRDAAALGLVLILLIIGLALAVFERIRNTPRSDDKQAV